MDSDAADASSGPPALPRALDNDVFRPSGETGVSSDAPSQSATLKDTVIASDDYVIPPKTRDFGLVPIPLSRRYDPNKPFRFTLLLNIIFAFASTTTVSNLYYCQPLLLNFMKSFGATDKEVALIPTISQAGYAAGLLFITPVGDLVRRRPLLLAIISLSTLFAMGVALAPNLNAMYALSFLLGLVTVTPQILLPFAGDLAPPERRASVFAIVLSGLILGVIFARAIGGIVADVSGSWRNVYWIGVGLQGTVLVLLWAMLPDWPSKIELINLEDKTKAGKHSISYFGILTSMAKLAVTEPILVQSCLIMFAMQLIYSCFWVTLTFLLSDPPYYFSTLRIGVFGLVGIFGVLSAPFVGRLLDRLVFWVGVLVAVLIVLVSQVIMTAAAAINLAAVVFACITLDLGLQMQQVATASHLFSIDPALRARLNAVYMISAFVGQVTGSAIGTRLFLTYGWRSAYGTSTGFVVFTFFVLLAKGPHSARYRWIGWDGGAKLTKDKPSTASPDLELGPKEDPLPDPATGGKAVS